MLVQNHLQNTIDGVIRHDVDLIPVGPVQTNLPRKLNRIELTWCRLNKENLRTPFWEIELQKEQVRIGPSLSVR